MILPKIWLGLVSSTRLSVAELLLGWLKLTCAALPRLNVFQSMAARCELWSILSTALPGTVPGLITAAPAVTTPPVGNWVSAGTAPGGPACAGRLRPKAASKGASKTPARTLRLPRPREISDTATQMPSTSFQTRRKMRFMLACALIGCFR